MSVCEGYPGAAKTHTEHLSSADAGLGASGASLAVESVAIAGAVSLLADVGVGKTGLADDVAGAGEGQGREDGTEGEDETHGCLEGLVGVVVLEMCYAEKMFAVMSGWNKEAIMRTSTWYLYHSSALPRRRSVFPSLQSFNNGR